MKQNIHKTVKFDMSIEPQDLSDGSANGSVIDTLGFSELAIVLYVGALGGTSPTLDVKVQNGSESNGSDMADVTGASFTQITTANDQDIYIAVIRQSDYGSRYYRAVSTIGGTTPVGEYAVGFALSGSRLLEVSQVNSIEFELNSPV